MHPFGDADALAPGYRRAPELTAAAFGARPGHADGRAAGRRRRRDHRQGLHQPGGVVASAAQTHPADGSAGAVVTDGATARRLDRDGAVAQLLSVGFARAEAGRMPKAPALAAERALHGAGLSMKRASAFEPFQRRRTLMKIALAPGALLLPLAAAMISGCGGGDPADGLAARPFADRCTQIAGQAMGIGDVVSTKLVDATNAGPQYCQVTGKIVTSPTSTINFRIDLPADASWNRKLVQIGGGGYDGVVRDASFVTMFNGDVRKRGYAFVGADGGVQTPNLSDTLNNPSAFDNFAFAYHPQVLQASLSILQGFYGRGPERKYFYGVSTGGREALLQAQRYPDHYDGIVAGEPVIDYSNVIQRGTALAQLAFANAGAGWLSPAKIALHARAQLAACDGLDGLQDGIISNVNACRFDPQTLRCPGGADTGDACLSDAQIASLRFTRSDYTLPVPVAFGATVAPAWGIGAEDDAAGGLTTMLFGPSPTAPASTLFAFSDFWLKYQVTSNVATTVLGYTLGSDAARWMELSQKVSANNPDLSAFSNRGGKLLLWAGASDHLVPPGYSIGYYERVAARFGQAGTDAFMRFYLLPGVIHGAGGPGAVVADLLGTLENWVEKNQAPDAPPTAAKRSADGSTVVLTRPMCRYPAWPKYTGSGDPAAAGSFQCVSD